MAEQKDDPLSPTVKKVFDEYRAALLADGKVDDESVNRLDSLLRKGKVPKFDEIDAALFLSPKRGKP